MALFPEKLFYKIGEVSSIVGVEPFVLRYWESEFPFLCPRKSKAGQRIYTKKEIELLLQIKKLLREERYTIDGVRRRLSPQRHRAARETISAEQEAATGNADVMEMVKGRIREILGQL